MQQIRKLLDAVSPPHVAALLKDLVEPILADGGLVSHRVLDGRLLMTLDGTEHHCAEAIDCPQCSTRTLAHGKTQSYHAALTPVIVAPVQATMLLSTPAFVATRDRQADRPTGRAALRT